MAVRTYTQGQSAESDWDLFGLLGPTITDAQVHEQLGMAVTSRTGDVWHVMIDNGGALLGFALVRPLKSQKSAHIRFLHAPGPALHARKLLASVLEFAQAAGLTSLHTNDRVNSTLWPSNGFTLIQNNRRGSFVRWQLNMEASS